MKDDRKLFLYNVLRYNGLMTDWGWSTVQTTAHFLQHIILKLTCYIDEKDGKVYQASNASIVGVEFDSIRYQKVDKLAMGRIIAERGNNRLLCVTTIDMDKYKEITSGNTDLPFVSLEMGGLTRDVFMDMSGSEQQANKGYPLQNTYYFSLKGRVVAARERWVKKEVKEDMKLAFKNLMEDRWWSWNDAASLQQLLLYFPD